MKAKQILSSPVTCVILFVLAAALLLGTTIGGARAVLTEESNFFTAGVEMYNIGVSIIENGVTVEDGVLMRKLVPEGDTLKLGYEYTEALSVGNTADIDEYVRVKVYKYWLDDKGNKTQEMSPDSIKLNFMDNGQNGWTIDHSSDTDERTILYYATPISANGGTSLPFTDTLTIDETLEDKVTQTVSGNVITTTFDYDGYQFVIRAEVDGVQTHNAADAIKSAWGVDAAAMGINVQ